MSRTFNTVPVRLRAQYGFPWWRSYGWDVGRGAVQVYARKYTRSARLRARADLRRGIEPEPYRPRGSAKWDAW